MRRDRPIALVVAHETSVESVQAILVLGHFHLLPIYSEGTILDAIRVPTHDSTEIRMGGFSIIQVVARVIVAHHHILSVAIAIRHQHRGQPRAIRYQGCRNILRTDFVGLKQINLRAAPSR